MEFKESSLLISGGYGLQGKRVNVPLTNLADRSSSRAELESGNAPGTFLQTRAPVLDGLSGPMGAQFSCSTGLGCGNFIGRAQYSPFVSSNLPITYFSEVLN